MTEQEGFGRPLTGWPPASNCIDTLTASFGFPGFNPAACRTYPATGKEDNMESPRLEYTAELLRHFTDLRDGT
ncbi:MAG TPA: hypothetical protein VGQ26_14430, partial [Streptosporangiaceae bacterium]|nr:hypothetical protein [Streptosporangiaceae bacterium]